MGAALGRPDKETWAVVGDGGLQMTIQEMLTTVVDHIPVKICLMDNKKLGMIRQWQEIVYGGNYHSSDLPAPQWDKLAEAYGMPTFKASSPEQVDDAIRSAQQHGGPALVWCEIEQTQNVLPMMPAGKGLSDLIDDMGQDKPPPADADDTADEAPGGRDERGHRGHDGGGPVAMAMNDPIAAPAKHAAKERYVPGSGQTHRHVLVVLVNNQPGVLNRVSSMVRSRNFNIESLAVGHTERPDISRMTITLRGDDFAVEQMGKQLYRLIDVLKVQDLPESGVVEHELALIKVRATESKRSEILRIIELYKGRVLDVGPETVIIEHSGTEQEIDSLVALLGGFGIKEMVRTGTIALGRGSGAIDLDAILRAGPEPATVPTRDSDTK